MKMKKTVLIIMLILFQNLYCSMEKKTVKVAVFPFEPMIFYKDSGETAGFFADLLEYIGEKEGWNIEYVKGSWAEGLERVKSGEVDIVTSVAYSEERDRFMDYSKESIFTVWSQVFSKPGLKLSNILEIENKSVGIMKNDFNGKAFIELAAKFNIKCNYKYYDTFPEIYQELDRGTLDAAVTAVTNSYAMEKKYKFEKSNIIFNPFNLYFTTGEGKNRELLSVIDRYLKEFKKSKDSFYDERLSYWIGGGNFLNNKLSKYFIISLIAAGTAALFFALIALILKAKVRKATKELREVNEKLQIEIEEHMAAEEVAREESEKAEKANRAKSQFLANMSHELRTPMNGVIGMVELMSETKLDSEQKEYLNYIKASADNLLAIINDILDISKIEAGKIELEISEFTIDKILRDVISAVTYSAHQKNIEIVCDVDEELENFIEGDEGKIRQILLNLVNNAVKFTQTGEVLIEIKKIMEQERLNMSEVEFSVRDTGVGIKESEKKRLFQPFEQGDYSYTKKYQGTGLGLAISKRLVEIMGGTIGFESEIGKGSRFFFKIGIKKSGRRFPNILELDVDYKKLKILFIDDNKLNREITKKMLEESGIKVYLAENGYEGIELLRKESEINFILLDIHMPKIDGFETVELINREFGKSYTILMFTSVDIRDSIERMKKLGVTDYLKKPVRRKELLEKIKFTVNKLNAEVIERGISEIEEKNCKIVVAEDNDINMITIVKMMQSIGKFEIFEARNGAEAVEMYKKERPDYIFMDIQMPVMNGLEAVREIRKLEQDYSKRSVITAVTAYATVEDRERCFAEGMDNYISKPFKIDEIKKVLQK